MKWNYKSRYPYLTEMLIKYKIEHKTMTKNVDNELSR